MIEERRRSERLSVPLEALLLRRSHDGSKERVPAVMANVSGGGAYMQSTADFAPGDRLLVVFRLSRSGRAGPHVAARAKVLRSTEGEDGKRAIAVRFTNHRFL